MYMHIIFMGVHVCIRVYVRVSSLIGLRVAGFGTIWWDMDPLQETRICVRRWPDRLVIWRSTYEMIWRSIPIHAVKTRWQFKSQNRVILYEYLSHSIFYCYLIVSILVFSIYCIYRLNYCSCPVITRTS